MARAIQDGCRSESAVHVELVLTERIEMKHLTMAELEAGLEQIRQAPRDAGILELIVRRPRVDEREVVSDAELSLTHGLVGDDWSTRGSARTVDGSANLEMQINIMSSRVIALVAQEKERWQL